MRTLVKLGWAAVIALFSLQTLAAQELAPRAYLITPLHANAITLTYSFYDGSLQYGLVPDSGATGTYSITTFSYYHALNFFGHSANIVASLPYGFGNFQGTVPGVEPHSYRSGLVDSTFRFSINLKGGPAMPPQKFREWKQKVLLGASLKVIAPTGQYDPATAINWGANRWSFKPEFGYSQRWRNWVVDGYFGVWFFTTNQEFLSQNVKSPGNETQSQKPIGALEGHLSYDFSKSLMWFSLDGNFWFGGTTSVNGVENPESRLANSRLGATFAVPISKHQSLKFSYSDGVHIRYGGNYQNVSAAWQYSWLGRPQ